ncbi:MAG: phosphomannomutase [Alterinioella nitratireducens]|uniref:phosphomannomutase n=1 Tax=Alterinioella nitratireducens TaxID=2735915 RepID=UPI0040589324
MKGDGKGQIVPPKFGTSGLRGLVAEMTPDLIANHVTAYLAGFPEIGTLYIGRDLRPSSPDIANTVVETALAAGIDVVDCGALPTPALALASLSAGAGAIMVTGSHIPADRNGLKFYTPQGEISKADEAAILAGLGQAQSLKPGLRKGQRGGRLTHDTAAEARFMARYVGAFGPAALSGLRLGLYAHCSAGRDLLAETLRALGAVVTELARATRFIPVDTEAVDPDTRARIAGWSAELGLDAIVSTDGDADRPLLADETGQIIAGDILGQITSAALGAETVVTPVSSNSGAEGGGRFARVIRTKIGSPHVIAAMAAAGGKVVGYEANGGYLLGFEAAGPGGVIAPLWTRDSFLPLITVLRAARTAPLSAVAAREPGGVTRSDRLTNTPVEISARLTAALRQDPAAFLQDLGESLAETDLTDGVRMRMVSGAVVHVRPSGNAPELRLYVEARNGPRAQALLAAGLAALGARVARIRQEAGPG